MIVRSLKTILPAVTLACLPALATGQSAVPPAWWADGTADTAGRGPALAPTDSPEAENAPQADGTELVRLSDTVRDAGMAGAATEPDDLVLDGAGVEDDGGAATLLADRITLSGDRSITATGGVVVWYQGARLVARSVRYDGATGAMTIAGPVHLTRAPGPQGDPEAVLIADEAQLSQDMREGLLRGARLVLAREMQMAAREVQLTGGGRYTTLTHVVASSCRICADDPTPLWEIRARRITHDDQTNILTFERPQLRAFGLPVAAWPGTITAPDPSVERLSGFLRPRIRTTSGLGFGVMTPWFQTLGPHADLTLTPYLSASRTATLMARYRQAFWNGATEWNAAISRDDLREGTRGYLFGAGRWDVARGYRLGLQVQAVSDRAYLLDYGISRADRLWSGVTLDRVRRDKLVVARIGNYESLREDEDNARSPAQVADARWRERFDLAGGRAELGWSAHAHRRPSALDIDGRDVARASMSFDWHRNHLLPGGVLAHAAGGITADLYAVRDDSRYEPLESRLTPWLATTLRWPLVGNRGGVGHVVEPVAQFVWSPRRDSRDIATIPNEDSRQIEFDEGNLFALSRFPGWDAQESGLRANLGIGWTRLDPAGWSLGVTIGRVLRDRADPAFSASGPMDGLRSDWLLAGHYTDVSGLTIANRALFDDDLSINRDELRIGWDRPDLQFSLGYLWMAADEMELRSRDISELTAEVGWQVADGWWANARTRHDFVADRAQMAGFAVTYRNECISVEMGATRRFTRDDEIRPETDFDLSVRLGGFGAASDGPGTVARRSCLR